MRSCYCRRRSGILCQGRGNCEGCLIAASLREKLHPALQGAFYILLALKLEEGWYALALATTSGLYQTLVAHGTPNRVGRFF